MTTLISWVSVDARSPSAIYLASDSRITWSNADSRWDSGRKLFAFSKHPDILGYSGDVLFPTQILSQVVELGDRGLLFLDSDESEVRHAKILKLVQAAFLRGHNMPDNDFDILHASRATAGKGVSFNLWRSSYSKKARSWSDECLHVPVEKSALVASLGSGSNSMSFHNRKWDQSSQGGTSRSIFGALCDSLSSGGDNRSGGPPQLVGLYREGGPKAYGVVVENVRYLYGMPLPAGSVSDSVEWRDTLFQRLRADSLETLSDAQRHARPIL